jgi:hypothetical protein
MRLTSFRSIICAAALAAAALCAHAAESNGRKLYKWVDQQGVTHYGDHIPPEYSAQEQHVINSLGIETARIEAQKTPEQVAAEEQRKSEVEQAARRDKNLLSTYGSVAEIERLRDQRLALLADQIKVKGQFLETLNGRLEKLRAGSMRFRPYSADPKAPPMTDQVAEDLVRTHSDSHTQEDNLREMRREESNMHKQFDSDIARFKELKGIH